MPPIHLSGHSSTAPRLEFLQIESNERHRVTIDHSPFKIGRCETSDLRIDSAQVSREHAEIYQRGSIWAIRDLGSTNGTRLNGKPVRESFLSDGDILEIAETELTFVTAAVTPFQRMATQPIQPRESIKSLSLLPSEFAQARALTEATLWQAIPLQLASVVSLATGEAEACFAQCAHPSNPADAESQFLAVHPMGRCYRELTWRRAIEMALAEPTADRIFVAADHCEFESPRSMFSDLEQLRDEFAAEKALGILISSPWHIDPAVLDEISRKIRQENLLLAYTNFQGSTGQVLGLASHAPDYLVLSDAMLKDATTSGQALRRLVLVLTACKQLGINAVLPSCACQRTIAKCRQLGYELAIQATAQNEQPDRRRMAALAC